MPKSLEDGLTFATESVGAMAWSAKGGWVDIQMPSVIGPAREREDDRDFLKQVIAEGPYRVPAVDLILSGYAEHLLASYLPGHARGLMEDYRPWITDNCQHCRAGLLKEIAQLLAVLRRKDNIPLQPESMDSVTTW